MDMTNAKREKQEWPLCPNCGSDLTGKTRNWGSASEGDYIVYQCDSCAEMLGSDMDGMVYHPDWFPR